MLNKRALNLEQGFVVLKAENVSDLFFNSGTPKYNEAIKFENSLDEDEGQTTEREHTALLEDAKDFIELLGGGVSADALAMDYLNRL